MVKTEVYISLLVKLSSEAERLNGQSTPKMSTKMSPSPGLLMTGPKTRTHGVTSPSEEYMAWRWRKSSPPPLTPVLKCLGRLGCH